MPRIKSRTSSIPRSPEFGCFFEQDHVRAGAKRGDPQARYKLEIADTDGQRARTLYSSPQPILSASWAPDGKRVAYVS